VGFKTTGMEAGHVGEVEAEVKLEGRLWRMVLMESLPDYVHDDPGTAKEFGPQLLQMF